MSGSLLKRKRLTARDRRLLLLYGITGTEYDEILAYQGGVCAICLRPPKRNLLNVDHRHADGLTRGLICMNDNKAIAYLRDDVDRAARLRDYLAAPPAFLALGRQPQGRAGRSTRRWRTKRERRERMDWVAKRLLELGYTSHGRRER